jgi:hypothetical protein
MPGEDLRVYNRMGRHGERLIPGYRYLQTFEGLYPAYGTQLDFGYLGLGRLTFTNELWGSCNHDLDDDGHTDAEETLAWHDAFGHGRSWIEFKPAQHPQLGEIEIGGWDQFATRMPPAEIFIEEGFRNALFTLYHAECFAELEFVSATAKPAGDGLYRVQLCLKNRGVMATDTQKAVERREDEPVRVTVEGASIAACGMADEWFKDVSLQTGKQDVLRLSRIGPESLVYAELLVRANAGQTLKLHASHPRATRADVEVKLP